MTPGHQPLRARHSVADWSDALAHHSAVHGAGAAAAITGAMGTALLAMCARQPRQGGDDGALADCLEEAESLREELVLLAEEDVLASAAEEAARALPQDDPDAAALRQVNLTAALIGASEVQIAVVRLASSAVGLARRLLDLLEESARSEAVAGAFLAAAAARTAYVRARGALKEIGVDEDVGGLEDPTREKTTGLLKQGARLLEAADLAERQIRHTAGFGL